MTTLSFHGKRVAAYARFSSATQRDASIEDQVRRCRTLVERNGGVLPDELVFADYAVSGASLERPEFQRLMACIENGEIDALVVEDVSRLSRDQADAHVLFRKLTYLDVPVVGVADGVDTSERHGKVTFGFKALMSDVFLDDLRDKTLRGLEGRAFAGYSTGGLPYGYTSTPDADQYGRSLGHRVEIQPEQAVVVRRIFEMYLRGETPASIAGALNSEGIVPPRAHTRHRHRGWVSTTVRSMLRNASYRGMWTFKKKEWRKLPGTNKRRYRLRPDADVIRRDCPERRIVDDATWLEVQSRVKEIAARYKVKGGTAGHHGRRTRYALSGVLECGQCGAPMVVTRGTSATYYKCGDAKNRKTCSNTLGLREEVARVQIFGELERRFTSPEAINYLRKAVTIHVKELSKRGTAELKTHQGILQRTEQRIGALIEFIAGGDSSPAVRSALGDLETQAKHEKAAIAALLAAAGEAIVLPSPDEVLRRGLRLKELLHGEPMEAQQALRRLFKGRLVLRPQPDRSYLAEGEYFPLIAMSTALDPKLPTPRLGAEAWQRIGCAGRI